MGSYGSSISSSCRLHSNAIRFTNGFPQSRKRLCPSDSKRNLTARHFELRTAVKDATRCVSADYLLTRRLFSYYQPIR